MELWALCYDNTVPMMRSYIPNSHSHSLKCGLNTWGITLWREGRLLNFRHPPGREINSYCAMSVRGMPLQGSAQVFLGGSATSCTSLLNLRCICDALGTDSRSATWKSGFAMSRTSNLHYSRLTYCTAGKYYFRSGSLAASTVLVLRMPTGNGKKLSCGQAQLGQATCLAFP